MQQNFSIIIPYNSTGTAPPRILKSPETGGGGLILVTNFKKNITILEIGSVKVGDVSLSVTLRHFR